MVVSVRCYRIGVGSGSGRGQVDFYLGFICASNVLVYPPLLQVEISNFINIRPSPFHMRNVII